MNEQLVQDILNLPFFEGKKVIHNAESLALHFRVDDDINMMFLPCLPGENIKSPKYCLYTSVDGLIIMDHEKDILRNSRTSSDGATVEKTYQLSTYNLEQHKQSGSVLSYDIITVLHAINEIIAFNTGE